MSTIEIQSKVEALRELESLIEEAKAEAETIRDEIKAEMLNRNTEELSAGQYIVRWTSVLSNRFDSTTLKRSCPMSTRPIPRPSALAASPSAHEKSPLREHRPKYTRKELTHPIKEGCMDYTTPLLQNQQEEL